MADAAPLSLTVISDTMCPWCYIGKRRLEKALDLMEPGTSVSVTWKPYQLDPTIPETGMSREEYLTNKFGREGAKEVYGQIRLAGEAEGIPFAFDKIEKSPNTLNSHQLIRWAGDQGVQDAVVERLFELFFIQGEDIGDHDILLTAAADAGMDRDEVARKLDERVDAETTAREIMEARQMGVEGVPFFVLAEKYGVPGAQAPEVLAGAMTQVIQEAAAGPESGDNDNPA